MTDILPDSRPKTLRGRKQDENGVWWTPIACANCGKSGGYVTEENMRHCFYLCDPCGEKYGAIAGTYSVPDEHFFAAMRAEQIEKYGRMLTEQEISALVDTSSPLGLIERDYQKGPARRA